jgi:environmental stress-induced protein Ves
MIRHLRPADYKVQRWANGRGETVEIARADGPDGILWRLSVAQVVEDGAFSRFPGINRSLTVIEGPGFHLRGEGVNLRADPLVPVAFSGEVAIRAEGVTAPSRDFNVMVAARFGWPEVRIGGPSVPAGVPCAIYALKAGGALWSGETLLTNEGVANVSPHALVVVLPRT